MLPSVAVTVIEVFCAAAMVPVAGAKVNQLGEVEATPLKASGVDVRFEMVNACGFRVAPGVPRNSRPLGVTTGGAAVPGGNDMQDNRDRDGRMHAVGRRENHRAVVILRGESGWIRGDRQRGRHRAGNAIAAGGCYGQPVSTLIGVGRNCPGNRGGVAEHGDGLRRNGGVARRDAEGQPGLRSD